MSYDYIMPLRAIEIYFIYIHSKIINLPEEYKRIIRITVLILYLCHLGVQHTRFFINLLRISKRQNIRKQRFENLLQTLSLLKNPPDPSIPLMTIQDLSAKAQDSELTPEMVVTSYQEKALAVEKSLNCIVDFIPVDFQEVKSIITILTKEEPQLEKGQQHLIQIDAISPPKHESLFMQFFDSTVGLSCNLDVQSSDDAVVVKVLRGHGAIPFIRTNVSQLALHWFASSNPIFGVTNHPMIAGRSPGGCSCGEGAFVANGGSILGVGTDIGGGVRIPAHFCGICGLKPTSSRVRKGITIANAGQEKLIVTPGPMSQQVDGLVRFMKAVSDPLQTSLDPKVAPISFNEAEYIGRKPLVIGYFIHDGYTKSIPAVERAINQTLTYLQAYGHTFVRFEPPDMKMMLTELYLPALLGNNSADIHNQLYTDRVDESIRSSFYTPYINYPLRWLVALYYKIMKNPMDAAIFSIKYPHVRDWWNLVVKIVDFKVNFSEKWLNTEIDVLLCPVLPFTACKIGQEKDFVGCLTHTALFNLVDYPAGCVPVTEVEKFDNIQLKNRHKYKVVTQLEKSIKKDQLDKRIPTIGLPVGVQVVGLPFHEELVLRVMREIEESRLAKLHLD